MYRTSFQDVSEAKKWAKQKPVLFYETPCSLKLGTIFEVGTGNIFQVGTSFEVDINLNTGIIFGYGIYF